MYPFKFHQGWNFRDSSRTNNQKAEFECLFNLLHCSQMVCSFKLAKDKSSWSDGPPAEFYLTFWNGSEHPVVDSSNYALDKGYLSDELGRVIISLISKPVKDISYLMN